jgi:serine/threonine protein kinase
MSVDAKAPVPPSKETARRYLLGQLTSTEAEDVSRYFDSHPDDLATVVSLDAEDTLESALRKAHSLPLLDTAEVRRIIKWARELALGDEGQAAPDSPGNRERKGSPEQQITGSVTDATDDPVCLLQRSHGSDELGWLGQYRVLRVLGQGGMGVVFEAEDTRLGRCVAVKAMLPRVAADPTAKQRFVREAKAAAAVEHDHVVAIHHIDEVGGVPFLVMPFLKGESLNDRLKRVGALPISEVIRIGREIAEGLAAAHAQGLVHRDIKPANLWLEAPRDRVRILDFGLARPAEKGPGTELTQSGAVVGTPAYMSPEQGRGQAVDFRTDLFSLGGVMYRACTGRTPFQGADTASMLMSLAADTPVDPRRLNPKVPDSLARLIEQLLEKDPARRPPSAREVARQLSPVVETLPAVADVSGSVFEFDTDDAEVVPMAAPVSNRRRVVTRIGLAVAVLAFGFALFYSPTIIRIVTDKGELVIEVDDPRIEVVVKGADAEIHDRSRDRKYVVRAGDGQVEFFDPDTGAHALTKTFHITRGGRDSVKATMAEVIAKRLPPKPKSEDIGPIGRLTVGDSLPAKDAFPGKLVFFDAFDDAKTTTLFQGEQQGARMAVEKGAYILELQDSKSGTSHTEDVGPTATDMAFAARIKAENTSTIVSFRNRNTAERCRWLALEITPGGQWSLVHCESDQKDGGWVDKGVRLAQGPAADPDLAAGKWITVAGRAVGREYELWLNGRRVAHGNDDDGFSGTNIFPAAIQFAVRAAADGRARLAIDYAAVWDLGGTSQTPSWTGDKPPPKDLFPGAVTAYETFDDPKDAGRFNAVRDGARFQVENGIYSVVNAQPKALTHYPSTFGAAQSNCAFAARVRCTGGLIVLGFRSRHIAERDRWLSIVIDTDGRWTLHHANTDLVDGKWVSRNHDVLQTSGAAVPELAAGQWINVAAQSIGDNYEVWINGRSVARGVAEAPGVPIGSGLNCDVEAKGNGPLRFDVDCLAVWSIPKDPCQWVGDRPPTRDLLTGEVIEYETFDDPKTAKVFQGTRNGISFAVENKTYVVSAPAGTPWVQTRHGPPVADTAFNLRIRSPYIYAIDFRLRQAGNRSAWLVFWVFPDGRWGLEKRSSQIIDGEWHQDPLVTLKDGIDPAAAANKWNNIAARLRGDDYDVFLNGVSVARGTTADAPPPKGTQYQPDRNVMFVESKPPDDKPARLEVGYIAIWKPPPAATKK